MSHFAYLGTLLLGIAGLLLIDYRARLAFFNNPRRTLHTLRPAVGLFIVWDLVGIALHIFAHGASRFSLTFTILPEFPIEEVCFLFLLCYVTLLLYLGVKRWRRM